MHDAFDRNVNFIYSWTFYLITNTNKFKYEEKTICIAEEEAAWTNLIWLEREWNEVRLVNYENGEGLYNPYCKFMKLIYRENSVN